MDKAIDVLDMLRGPKSEAASRIAQGEFAFWLGSAISFDRMPGLRNVLRMVLEKLKGLADFANSDCPYAKALTEVSTLSGVDGLKSHNPDDWEVKQADQVIENLVDKYSEVLDLIIVDKDAVVSIPWDLLNLVDVYADDSVPPDAEHLFVALLSEEGIIPEIVTTNWDALIEDADACIHEGAQTRLVSIAKSSELSLNGSTAIGLLKIHGCARKKKSDPTAYRLVGTTREIQKWILVDSEKPFRVKAMSVLYQRPCLFVGLSGQDYNLRLLLTDVPTTSGFPPSTPPRIIFGKPKLANVQQQILLSVYGEDAYAADQLQLEDDATIPIYAKPLLGGLFLYVLWRKAHTLTTVGTDHFPSADFGQYAHDMIDRAMNDLASSFDRIVRVNDRWSAIANEIPAHLNRSLRLARSQEIPASSRQYSSPCRGTVDEIAARPETAGLSYHWLILTVAMLWDGHQQGLWTISGPTTHAGNAGHVVLTVAGLSMTVFIQFQSSNSVTQLAKSGYIDACGNDGATMLFVTGTTPTAVSRSPSQMYPGVPDPNRLREIYIWDIVAAAKSPSEALTELRNEFLCKIPISSPP